MIFTGLPPNKHTTAQSQRNEFANQLNKQTNIPNVKVEDWNDLFLLLAKELTNAGRFEGDPVSIKDDADTVTTASGTWHWSAEEDIRRWIAEGNPEKQFPDLFYAVDIVGMTRATASRITDEWKRAATVLDIEFAASDEADR